MIDRRSFVHAAAAMGVAIPNPASADLRPQVSEVFLDVRLFGARGDGQTDDTRAIQAALTAASSAYQADAGQEGAVVTFPPGRYQISESLEVPMGVKLQGSGSRATRIRWSAGTADRAVVTSNLRGEYGNGFAHAIRIEGIRFMCSGQAVGMWLTGWNESCYLDDVEVSEFSDQGIVLDAVELPATRITQHTGFRNIRLIPNSTATRALRLRAVRRCAFFNVTVDQPSTATGPCDIGISMEDGSQQNVFIGGHLEDCSVPIEIGVGGRCEGNIVMGFDCQNPHAAPEPISGGPAQGDTACVLIRSGSSMYTFQSWRDGYGFDHLLYDEDRTASVSGGFGRLYQRIDGGHDGLVSSDTEIRTRRVASAVGRISAGDTSFDVSAVNSLRADTSGGAVVIPGLSGGVAGQRLSIYKATAEGRLVIEHDTGAVEQRIMTPNAMDLNLNLYGGVTLECDGETWFVIGRT